MHEWQIYAIDKDGLVVHAGVHKADGVDMITVVGWERDWRRWRRAYLRNHPGDYPLRHCNRVVAVTVRKCGTNETNRFQLNGLQAPIG